MAGQGGQGKPPEAACPMCGSVLAKSPAGQAHMQMLAQVGKKLTQPPRPQGGQAPGAMRKMTMRPGYRGP